MLRPIFTVFPQVKYSQDIGKYRRRGGAADRASDLRFTGLAGLSPAWEPFRSGLGQLTSYLHLCASVTKLYNLVLDKGVISLAGKVTASLVESNGSLYHRVYD